MSLDMLKDVMQDGNFKNLTIHEDCAWIETSHVVRFSDIRELKDLLGYDKAEIMTDDSSGAIHVELSNIDESDLQ